MSECGSMGPCIHSGKCGRRVTGDGLTYAPAVFVSKAEATMHARARPGGYKYASTANRPLMCERDQEAMNVTVRARPGSRELYTRLKCSVYESSACDQDALPAHKDSPNG